MAVGAANGLEMALPPLKSGVDLFGRGRVIEQTELEQVEIVAFLDSTAGGPGLRYRGRPGERPARAPGPVDLVLCSSFRHEWAQIEILDRLPVKAVFSHQPGI